MLYVDVGLITSTKRTDIDEFLSKLTVELKMTAGNVGCFLNIMIESDEDGSIFIHQNRYVEDTLKRFNMQDANPVLTHLEECLITVEETNILYSIEVPYRKAIGCLMYLNLC